MPLARSHQQLDHGEAVGVEIEGFDRLGAGGSRQESHPQINVEYHLIGVATTLVDAYYAMCNGDIAYTAYWQAIFWRFRLSRP